MKKEEFVQILNSLSITVAEGINKDKDTSIYPRIIFWEIFWDFLQASNENYNTVVTYQVSFFSRMPRDPKLLELVKTLLAKGVVVHVSHEYIQKDKYWHSYFSLDLLENVIVCTK